MIKAVCITEPALFSWSLEMFGKGNTRVGRVSAVIHPLVSDEDINAWNLKSRCFKETVTKPNNKPTNCCA
jgi:hypothetical protein